LDTTQAHLKKIKNRRFTLAVFELLLQSLAGFDLRDIIILFGLFILYKKNVTICDPNDHKKVQLK